MSIVQHSLFFAASARPPKEKHKVSVSSQQPRGKFHGVEFSGQRVLVVEDELLISIDLADSLRQHGAAIVGPAATLREALALAGAKEAPDCAVLDLRLSGEMVFPVADALAERGVPFVFLTGYHEDVIPTRYANVPRFEKPFDHAAVLAELFRLVAQKASPD